MPFLVLLKDEFLVVLRKHDRGRCARRTHRFDGKSNVAIVERGPRFHQWQRRIVL